MAIADATPAQGSSNESRDIFRNAARFWETRRLVYNALLAAVVILWLVITWPHFRNAPMPKSLVLLAVLALIANVCYCAAYLVDIPIQHTAAQAQWRKYRWILWLLGTIFAIVLANYWIVDEIYPFVD